MRRLLGGAALCLLLATGCDRLLMPPENLVYAPWEEGLTLGFEDPSLAPAEREQSRFQVRVKESRPGPQGRVVVLTHTTLAGQTDLNVLLNDGGEVLGTDPANAPRVLPEGFPDRVSRWQARGSLFQVVGRSTFRLPGQLPADQATAIGVWVEATPLNGTGARTRALYLPGVGAAETLVWQDGTWKCVFRLVSRGFTDVSPRPSTAG